MVKLKICGIRCEEDINIVNKYDIDFIGFVFAKSPRKVSKEEAKKLSDLLNNDIIPVGVFVNEDIDFIVDLFNEGIIEIAQLHGDEDEEYIKELKYKSKKFTGNEITIIQATEISKSKELTESKVTTGEFTDSNENENSNEYKCGNFVDKLLEWRTSAANYFILDSGKGSGKTFNWDLIDENPIFKEYLFLAGGINKDNIDSAIEKFNPFAVDLSSGVETDGFKDEDKIKEIVELINNYKQ